MKQHLPVRIDMASFLLEDRKSMTIEEFQDLNRDLAPIVQAISETGCREPALRILCRQLNGDTSHHSHGGLQKKMIKSDFLDITALRQDVEELANMVLTDPFGVRDVAYSGRTVRTSGEVQAYRRAEPFVFRSDLDLATGATHPHAVHHHHSTVDQPCQEGSERRNGKDWLQRRAQLLHSDARKVGMARMEQIELGLDERLKVAQIIRRFRGGLELG
jgi:hypothetical protein